MFKLPYVVIVAVMLLLTGCDHDESDKVKTKNLIFTAVVYAPVDVDESSQINIQLYLQNSKGAFKATDGSTAEPNPDHFRIGYADKRLGVSDDAPDAGNYVLLRDDVEIREPSYGIYTTFSDTVGRASLWLSDTNILSPCWPEQFETDIACDGLAFDENIRLWITFVREGSELHSYIDIPAVEIALNVVAENQVLATTGETLSLQWDTGLQERTIEFAYDAECSESALGQQSWVYQTEDNGLLSLPSEQVFGDLAIAEQACLMELDAYPVYRGKVSSKFENGSIAYIGASETLALSIFSNVGDL